MMTQEEKEEISLIIQSVAKQTVHSMAPDTRKELDDIKRMVRKHIDDETDELKKLTRVVFGDRTINEIGMNDMVKDMHTKIVQANGVVSFLKLVVLIGSASGFLYMFFRKF